MRLKVKLLEKDSILPYYQEGSAAMEFTTIQDVEIMPGRTELIRTGLAIEIPDGHYLAILPKNYTGLKTPLRLSNSMSIVDSTYRGELMLPFTNTGKRIFKILKGRRLAHGIILPIIKPEFIVSVDFFNESKMNRK